MIERLVCWLTAAPYVQRDNQWPNVRARYLAWHPQCEACGREKRLEVHHVYPVHFPGGKAQELEPNNLITLCRRCHLLFGHLLSWRAMNPDVRLDAVEFLKKIRNRKEQR